MDEYNATEIDFINVSPFLRFIHKDSGTSKEYFLPWRIIYDYEIIYVFDGVITVKTESSEYDVNVGDIHVMHPFVKHKRYIPEGKKCQYFSVHFDLVFMGIENDFSPIEVYSKPCTLHLEQAEVSDVLSHRPLFIMKDFKLPSIMKTIDRTSYIRVLNSLLEAFTKKDFGYEIDTKIGLLSLFKLILSDMHIYNIDKNFCLNSDKIPSIIQYVYDNYNKDIDLNAFASSLGFSPNYFRKVFKQATSKTPIEYLIDLRIERAIELIKEGKNTVSETSQLVGYKDIHYFSKLFKQKKGCSPSNYIEKIKN